MRISGVTGDLPAVAAPAEPSPAAAPDPPPPPPAVAPVAAAGSGTGAGAHDPRRDRPSVPMAFNPPLIAQRAALGLPVGMLISELAQAQGIPFAAACAAVDREMTREG